VGILSALSLERHREIWAGVAKENGWYVEPFYVQVWQNEAGEIWNSVSHIGIKQDSIILEEEFDEG